MDFYTVYHFGISKVLVFAKQCNTFVQSADGKHISLNVPAQDHLCRAFSVPCSNFPQRFILKNLLLAFRKDVTEHYSTVQIVDSPYYGVDTFTLCEMNDYILITQPVYADIHSNLVTIPLKTKYTLPYGLMYANEPTSASRKFINSIKELQ